MADRADEQIEIAIAVEIHEHCAGGIDASARNPRGVGDILEFPVAEVSVERVRTVQSTEIEIAPAVAVDITGGHARAVQENVVGQRTRFGHDIGEPNAGGFRGLQFESTATCARWSQDC